MIEYGYDSLRRLTQQKATGLGLSIDDHVQSIGYAYDSENGSLTTITSYADNACQGTVRNQVKLEPNSLGMIDKEYQAHGGAVVEATDPNVAYRYDATHASGVYTKGMRLNRIEYPNGRFVHYTYAAGVDDDLSRVTSINDDNGSGEAGATVFSSYEYDGGGRIVVEDYATAQVRLDLWGQNTGTYAGLDRFGRVKQQWWRDYEADANVDKFTYGYDRNSNRLWKENVVPGELETPKHLDELYAYDKLNRLTAADRGNLNANKDAVTSTNFRQAWTLDDVGNWTTFQQDDDGTTWDLEHEREHNLANEIEDTDSNNDAIETTTGTDWDDPAHDAAGNMTEAPKPGDETAKLRLTYDAWNRLVKVEKHITGEVYVSLETCSYDGLHRRIRRVDLPGNPLETTLDFYYSRAWQVLEVRKDGESDAWQQYIWSLRYIDACVLRDEDTDSDGDCTDAGGSERVYYCNGANMEVTALLEADGDVTERYLYDPYGQVDIRTPAWAQRQSSVYANEILYCGYRYDPDANMYHVRYRMYDPTLGRWLQRDMERYLEGMSLYGYVLGDPVGRVDFLGAASIHTTTQYRMPRDMWFRYTDGIEIRERRDWQLVRMAPWGGHSRYRARHLRNCRVVIELAHLASERAYGDLRARAPIVDDTSYPPFVPTRNAVGTLTCWADTLSSDGKQRPTDQQLNYSWSQVGVGAYALGSGYGGYETKLARNAGTIDGFPLIQTSIGPRSGDNATFGAGAAGFKKLLDFAWEKAVAQAKEFAEDCRCECERIEVYTICHGGDARAWAGWFCRLRDSFPCKANVIGTEDCEEK